MNLNLIFLLSFLVSFQLLFVGIFLISHKKGNRRNNILFSSLFFLIAWNIGNLTLQMNGVILKWEFFQHIDDGFFLLFGPIIFIYTKCVIYRDFKLAAKNLLHLIPYLLLTIMLLLMGNLTPGKLEEIIKNNFSQVDQINLNWLSFSIKTFAALTFVSLIQNFIALAENESLFIFTLIILLVFIFYFVNKVILKALRQPEIFAGITQKETNKYEGSNLTPEQVEKYKLQLLDLLDTEKPFLNPQVSLTELAETLSISAKHLSQVINQSFHKNFFDFINAYRIQEVQKILKESSDDKITILEAMYQAGFNSKSSFNTAFKKETGLTPTEFRKMI